MSISTTSSLPKEGLDRKFIAAIGYKPTCIIVGTVLGLVTRSLFYAINCIDLSRNIDAQLDIAEYLLAYINSIALVSLSAGFLIGLITSLITPKLKPNTIRILINSFIGAIIYLLVEWVYRIIRFGSFANSIDYLRFFAKDILIVGFIIGLLISFLPLPNQDNK